LGAPFSILVLMLPFSIINHQPSTIDHTLLLSPGALFLH
jgi:hypothetical protein